MWFVVYLFLCLLFLPFSLLQSSTARDKDEQTLPVGNSGSVCTLSVCLWRVWGRGGRRRAHVLNKPPSPLGYLNGLIYRYICILRPLISVNCILIITDIQIISGTRFQKVWVPSFIWHKLLCELKEWNISKLHPMGCWADIWGQCGISCLIDIFYVSACPKFLVGNFFWFLQKKCCMRPMYLIYT